MYLDTENIISPVTINPSYTSFQQFAYTMAGNFLPEQLDAAPNYSCAGHSVIDACQQARNLVQVPHSSGLLNEQTWFGTQYVPVDNVYTSAWNHAVPSGWPWFKPDNPFLVQVNDEPRHNMACKRNSLHLEDSPRACKQHISEEVMAARMNQLYISNSSSNFQVSQTAESHEARMLEEAEHLGIKSSDRVVVLSPELKQLKDEPIIPKCIMEKMQKPSMELVLWKPPAGAVDRFIKDTLAEKARQKLCRTDADMDEQMSSNERSCCEEVISAFSHNQISSASTSFLHCAAGGESEPEAMIL